MTYESGYYPAGTEYDPAAPWNDRVTDDIPCPHCGGQGRRYNALDIADGSYIECSKHTFYMLPEYEDEAIVLRQRFIRGEVEECPFCHGEGFIEPDYCYHDYDYDDE